MDEEFKNSIKNIVWALRRIVNLTAHDSSEMVKRYGITGPQSLVFKTLNSSEVPLSSVELSRKLNVTPSNITGIIDRLEEKGLVQRIKKQNDRRTSLLELTDKGKDFAGILPDLIEDKLMRGLSNLSPTEVYGIYSALENIIKIIGEEKVDKAPLDQD